MSDGYTVDYLVIEQDLTEAPSLEFGPYAGFLANYGTKLRQLAEMHECPQAAFQHLRIHADAFLDELNGN